MPLAVETALWDLMGKTLNLPLYKTITVGISAARGGLAGVLWAINSAFVAEQALGFFVLGLGLADAATAAPGANEEGEERTAAGDGKQDGKGVGHKRISLAKSGAAPRKRSVLISSAPTRSA